MKKILLMLLITVVGFTIPAAETNRVTSRLPPCFSKMTQKDLLPGMIPAAVYAFHGEEGTFICPGAVYSESETVHVAILPSRIFDRKSGYEGCYGVRLARPDSGGLAGSIEKISPVSADPEYSGAVIATLGKKRTIITNLSIGPRQPLVVYSDKIPVLGGLAVSNVTSLLTGKQILIVGHGIPIVSTERISAASPGIPLKAGDSIGTIDIYQDFLIVDIDPPDGTEGEIFFDGYNRIYVLNDSPLASNKLLDSAKEEFKKSHGTEAKGVVSLTGPLKLRKRD